MKEIKHFNDSLDTTFISLLDSNGVRLYMNPITVLPTPVTLFCMVIK